MWAVRLYLVSMAALEVEYTLDSKKNAPRMYFLKYEGRNKFRRPFNLSKGQMECDTGYVYIKVCSNRYSQVRNMSP